MSDEQKAPRDARTVLLRRRAELVQEIRAGAEKRAAGRNGNVPDSGELAAENVARDVILADVDRDAAELEEVDAALARLDQGTYGRCVECGTAVPEARLLQIPHAARCIACEEQRHDRTRPRLRSL